VNLNFFFPSLHPAFRRIIWSAWPAQVEVVTRFSFGLRKAFDIKTASIESSTMSQSHNTVIPDVYHIRAKDKNVFKFCICLLGHATTSRHIPYSQIPILV
jgi:hypothetical protein